LPWLPVVARQVDYANKLMIAVTPITVYARNDTYNKEVKGYGGYSRHRYTRRTATQTSPL